jgi:hypothetical protein
MLRRVALVRNDVLRMLITVNVVSSSLILVTLVMEVVRSSETSDLSRATLRNMPEDGILLSHHRQNPKSYIALTDLVL